MRWKTWLLVAFVLGLILSWHEISGAQQKPKKLNPYTGNLEVIKEGRRLFALHNCSFCHGRLGGGDRQGPSLLDNVWVYGGDDETLMKLIKGQIKQSEHPNLEEVPEDQVWKILAYIRSLYKGDPSGIVW